MEKHEHKLKRVYYRKKLKNKKYQDFVAIPKTYFCDDCGKLLFIEDSERKIKEVKK